MTKILWISRHLPQPEQVAALENHYGPVEVVQRAVALDNDPAKGAAEVAALMAATGATALVGVMPVPHLAELTRRGIKPLRAVMNRVPTGLTTSTGEVEYRFDFVAFERVTRVTVETEPF